MTAYTPTGMLHFKSPRTTHSRSIPTGYSTVRSDPVITELAKKYGVQPAQIVLAWHVQRGVSAVPQSSSAVHQKENLTVRRMFMIPIVLSYSRCWSISSRSSPRKILIPSAAWIDTRDCATRQMSVESFGVGRMNSLGGKVLPRCDSGNDTRDRMYVPLQIPNECAVL